VNVLNISLLFISWARLEINDKDLFDRSLESLINSPENENLNEDNIQEVCKIM